MGISSDGQISYGIAFEEETEFPWGEHEIEEWWRELKGYKPSVQLYDSEGQYLNGKQPSNEEIKAYYNEQRAWEAANPLPVQLVLHCSYDYAMHILAVPGTFKSASRGHPEELDPAMFTVSQEQRDGLMAFCREHGIESPGEPRWWLSSLYG